MTNCSSLQESPILTSCSENADRRTSASNSDEKSDSDAGKKDRLQHHFSGIKQRRTKGWNTPGSKTLQNIYGVAQKSGEVKYKVQSKGIRLPKLTSNEVPSLESSPRTTAGLALPMHTFQIQMFMDLRNESKELRRKLNDALRENCVIRRLQIRQERALARYESQEAELPRLMASHIAEVQVLHEAVRRAREAERIAAKRATRCEAELNKSQEVLQHLQGLAKRRDLEERDQLSRKLEQAEKQLKEMKFNNQGLRRNLQLNKNSFQRQLLDEQRHTTEFQTIASSLQAEVLRLTHKLEDKERDLVTLNMYSARLFKSSPRKKEPRQLKECVAGSITSPSDIVSHTGSQKKVSGKFTRKKKQLDAYFDPIDCSAPRFKENKNVEEEELTMEAKGETAEDPDVVKNTISSRENESQEATSHSSTALNYFWKLLSPLKVPLTQNSTAAMGTFTQIA
uniref:Lebercilin domain-containing protein n=1 Tax=Eptatretus burgeri TaxID=7764 RepID=A0A8C4WVJ0_EPTBU